MDLNISSKIKLNNNINIPIIGLGVWQIPKDITTQSVLYALEAGYRLIDTAFIYKNEKEVGQAFKETEIPRDEIFVTTKLWPTSFLNAEKAFHDSLKRLGLEYLDLYLIHWPVPVGRNKAWKTLEKLYEGKYIRAIGVSNYNINHLKNLESISSIPPAVNQIPINPFSYDSKLIEYCRSQNIVVEAYSPLGRGQNLEDPRLKEIAGKYHKSDAQIMLRWAIQNNIVVIPKSAHKERIQQNIEIFDFNLSAEDIHLLNELNTKEYFK